MEKPVSAKVNIEIETSRLNFKLLSLEDTADIYDYARDPLVSENTSWDYHKSIKDSETFVQYVVSRHNLTPGHARLVWGVQAKGDPKVIGTVSFVQDNEQEGHVDYALSRDHWGQGYMTEAIKAVISWAFNALPLLRRVNSGCLSRNIGSVMVLRKVGFEITRRYESQRGPKFDNQILETTLFSLSRQDWQSNQE